MSDEQTIGESFFDVSDPSSNEGRNEGHNEGRDDDPLVGSILDERYRLDRLLGEGGMGRVYAGTQLSIERDVAIKLLRSEALTQREVKERFLREAKVISGFSHPNIVRLIDYGEDNERRLPYLVMELVKGVSLGALTRRGRLELPLALEIAYQVCGALVQAHSEGIVHRDLKPDNLHLVPVVGDAFQAKVLDFGIAFPSNTTSRLTSTGMICGTSYYIAPEQARALDLDGRADLYALGIILYEMLSGQLPFTGDSDFQILLMQVQQPPPPLADYLPSEEVPPEVIKLVHDLLAKEPDHRPPSARAVRERIDVIRTRCAIAPFRADLDGSSVDTFGDWILPASAHLPVTHAETELDISTPTEALEKLASRRRTQVEDESNQPLSASDSTDDDGAAPAAEASLDQTASDGSKLKWLAAALFAAIGVAGAIALYLWLAGAPAPPADEAPPTANPTQRQDSDPAQENGGVTDRVDTRPITDFAGRCMVIGETDTWFHNVFLYPEVGELMLVGDERLQWSRVEIAAHEGSEAVFSYHVPDEEKPQRLRARASTNKLIFEMSQTKSKFVCRKHAIQKYYETLSESGTFLHTEERERRLMVPSSGQRLELDGAEYAYRILDGRSLDEGLLLALKKAEGPRAIWQPKRVRREADSDTWVVGEGENAQRYQSQEARTAPLETKEHQTRRASKPKLAPPSQPTPQPTPQPTQRTTPQPTPTHRQAHNALAPAPNEIYERYEKELVKVVQRFCDAQEGFQRKIDHYKSLMKQGRREEARRFHEENIKNSSEYRKELTTISHSYSNTYQRAILAGVNSVQMQKLPTLSDEYCK